MKHALSGIVALVAGVGLTASCTGLVDHGSGQPVSDASGQDRAMSCGGSGELCCDGTACNNGLMCSGGMCSGFGSGSGSDAGDASPTADGAQGDLCAAPLTIAPGQTIHATTCGGVAGVNEPCVGGPVVPIALDAPDGANVEFTVSPGARFLVFPTCQSNGPVECSDVTNSTFESIPGYILAVNRYDTNCGDFTLSAAVASDAGEPPDAPSRP